GVAFRGTECFLADDGEECIRGGNGFLGDLDDPEKTAEALDPDGTLHSGDIGEFDDEGYLRIVDRKKELIITAGGKNISPANLESKLKAHSLIGTACVIGDQRPFLTALMVLDPDIAPVWAGQHGLSGLSLAELSSNPELLEEIQRAVDQVNEQVSNVEGIKKFTVLGEDWLPGGEE